MLCGHPKWKQLRVIAVSNEPRTAGAHIFVNAIVVRFPSTKPASSALAFQPITMKIVDNATVPSARTKFSKLHDLTLSRACSSELLSSYQPTAITAAAARANVGNAIASFDE
jgi:hypothetical protein